jgi:hypothetical protein
VIAQTGGARGLLRRAYEISRISRSTQGKPYTMTGNPNQANDPIKTVLTNYPRAVAHLRRQLDDGRLGLIFGAGASRPYGLPDWKELVNRIATDPAVDAGSVFTSDADLLPLPIFTEVLYQRYRQRHQEKFSKITSSIGDLDRLLLAGWRRIIHHALYEGIPEDPAALYRVESAYQYFINVVKKTPFTVTYNFDDTLERLLLHIRSDDERAATQTFQSIVDARLPYKQGRTVILHINGYLPHQLLDSTSDVLIFNEGTFADQLIDVMAGQFSSLLHHLTKNTCLLIGLSLNDETLRHLLRQSARLSPGNYHYLIRYISPDSDLPYERRTAESVTNFETYNLITLYLTDAEMKTLGEILTQPAYDVVSKAEEAGVALCYTYYIVGVPGVGKTTTVGHFNSLVTHDEWLEPMNPLMGMPFVSLNAEQEAEVDKWVLDQVGLKNRRMLDTVREAPIGIHLIDRCPLDAITFKQPDGWAAKARDLLDAIQPGKASARKTHDGELILMKGDPAEIRIRAATRDKETSVEYSCHLHEALEALYCGPGTVVLDVGRMSVQDVVKAVARTVFRDSYRERGLHDLLLETERGRITAPGTVKA